jgi:hypothetical protein
MIMGYLLWTLLSLLFVGIGIWARRSEKPAVFFAGIRPERIRDVREYNRAIACLWFVYAGLFALLGLPFLFFRQNSAGFLLPVLGVPVISIAAMAIGHRITTKFEKASGNEGGGTEEPAADTKAEKR